MPKYKCKCGWLGDELVKEEICRGHKAYECPECGSQDYEEIKPTKVLIVDDNVNFSKALKAIKPPEEIKPIDKDQTLKDALWWIDEALNNADLTGDEYERTKNCRDNLKRMIEGEEVKPD